MYPYSQLIRLNFMCYICSLNMTINSVAVEKIVLNWIGVPESCLLFGYMVVLISPFQFFLPILHIEISIY